MLTSRSRFQAVLERYLQTLVSLPLRDRSSICDFLNTGVATEPSSSSLSGGAMEGFLTKRGRNFGGWQVSSPVLLHLMTKEADSNVEEGMADTLLRSHSRLLPLLLRDSERSEDRRDSSTGRCDRPTVFFSSGSRRNDWRGCVPPRIPHSDTKRKGEGGGSHSLR